jgi:hypothetical protein
MNKLTKIGLSALCGSLASVTAANAGSMEVTGAAHMTHVTVSGKETGNPFGMKTNLSFTGSGELDGGQEVSVLVAHGDQNVYSSANITLTTNSLGKLQISQAEGGAGVGGYDDNMPRAWEEVWDTGITVGADLTKGVGSSTNINWTSPSGPLGTTLQVAYAPRNNGVKVNDKAVSGKSGNKLDGLDIVLDMNPSIDAFGVNLFAGYSVTDLDDGAYDTDGQKTSDDHEEGTAGIILTMGPVKAGFQRTFEHLANQDAGTTEYYANLSWGVSLNVNDNLSVSYSEFESRKGFIAREDNESRKIDADSLQIAYTVGGASLKFAETEVNNAQYVTSADNEATTISLALAF